MFPNPERGRPQHPPGDGEDLRHVLVEDVLALDVPDLVAQHEAKFVVVQQRHAAGRQGHQRPLDARCKGVDEPLHDVEVRHGAEVERLAHGLQRLALLGERFRRGLDVAPRMLNPQDAVHPVLPELPHGGLQARRSLQRVEGPLVRRVLVRAGVRAHGAPP